MSELHGSRMRFGIWWGTVIGYIRELWWGMLGAREVGGGVMRKMGQKYPDTEPVRVGSLGFCKV